MLRGHLVLSQVALVVKNPPASAGDIRDAGSIPGLGRSSEGGNGKPLQYSCLENPMDRGAWRATVQGVKKSQTRLSHTHTHTHTHTRTNLGASHVVLMLKEPTSQCGRLKRRSLIPGSKDPLGEGMATHSSVLAWRIPWAEEPGRLQSIELQRVQHN